MTDPLRCARGPRAKPTSALSVFSTSAAKRRRENEALHCCITAAGIICMHGCADKVCNCSCVRKLKQTGVFVRVYIRSLLCRVLCRMRITVCFMLLYYAYSKRSVLVSNFTTFAKMSIINCTGVVGG